MPLDEKLFASIMSGSPVATPSAAAPNADMASGAITDIIRGAAERYDVDPEVMLRLAQRESSLNPSAKNPKSTAGGLFQFIDGTWNRYGRGDKFDPVANADAAARMMRDNLDRFGGNYDAALAAHHVGPEKALQALRDPSIGDVDVSTQQWLAKIKGERQARDDLAAARKAGYLGEDRVEHRPDFAGSNPASAGSRSALQAIGDTGAALLKGAGGLGESVGGLYGLATGDVDPNIVQIGGQALSDFAESLKSDFIKNKERISQEQIANADGMLNQFATAAWNNVSDPALFVNTLAEQAANFIPGMAAGRIAKGLIAGLGGASSASAFEAASAAEKAMMIKRLTTAGQVGTGVSVATGAIMQGADAGNSAYQQVMARPQAEWDAHPEYQRLVTTLGMQGAKQQIALQEARSAFAKSAIASAGLNAFAPAHAIDKMLVNGIKGRALSEAERAVAGKLAGQGTLRAAATGATKGFAGEAISESLDEGYGQFAANQAESAVNPNKDLTDEVGANAGLGFAFGPMGAVGGTFDAMGRKKAAQEALANSPAPANQPNSPLSRAASRVNLPAIDPRAQPAVLGEAPRGADMADRQGQAPLEGEYMPADGGDKPMLESPQGMADRRGAMVPGGPNFTMSGEGESPTTAKGNRGRQGAASYALGAPRAQLTHQEQQVVSAAEAEYEAAYADLIKAEQLGAGDAELMQRQIAMRDAEARLQEINAAIDSNRRQETAAKRDALLGQVLGSLPAGQNPNRAFDRALRAAGFTDTQFTDAERAKIEQWQGLSQSFGAEPAREASAPNQMDAAAVGIKQKTDGAQPSGQPGDRLREVDAMLANGMVRRGDRMEDPMTGNAVKLTPAQIARAKHVEKMAERDRILPAYRESIKLRMKQLEQMVADPNHDEAQAVRLANGISVMKGIVSALNRGASMDEAITSVLGDVPQEARDALKNPRIGGTSETVADAQEPAPAPKKRGGGSALPAGEMERAHRYAQELTSMAPDAGWAEFGGRLIRDANDNATARTKWIPRAEWFLAGMLNSPQESIEAVRKALAGEPMLKRERLHVMGMMDWLDAQHATAEEHGFIESIDAAISDDSDFGLPDYSAEMAAVVELEFTQGAVDMPAFLEAIGANDEENHVTQDEAGAGQAGGAAAGKPEEDGQDGEDAAGPGRNGPRSEGFDLASQTNQEAAAQFAQQQAGDPADVTKAQADKERDAVPFSLTQQSQAKPQGVQGGLFTADGRPSVAAKQEEPKKPAQGDLIGASQGELDSIAADIKEKTRQLVALEDKMIGLAGLGQGFIEDALRSRKVPGALKDQRHALKVELADLRKQHAELVISGDKLASVKEKTGQWAKANPAGKYSAARRAEAEKAAEEERNKPQAWHTELPTQGLPITDDQRKPGGYSRVPMVLAEDAYQAITQTQMTNGMPLYAYYLPADGALNGIVRLIPDDQKRAPASWKLLNGQALRPAGQTKEQITAKLAEWLRQVPILGDEKADASAAASPKVATPASGGKYAGPADVSSKDGQLELANRGSRIASLKAMNDQLRQMSPSQAMSDQEIENAANLDALQDSISDALVKAQRGAKAADENDFAKYVLISADDISKLRKIDVERVLAQGAVKDFRPAFADWIKARRPDLVGEVDDVMADLAPKMNEADRVLAAAGLKPVRAGTWSITHENTLGRALFNVRQNGTPSKYRVTKSQTFDSGVTGAPTQEIGIFDTPQEAVQSISVNIGEQKPKDSPAKTGLDKAADAIDSKIDDVAARLAAKLKASRGTLNSGVDPELLMLGAELGSLYIAKGFVKFAQYSRAILDKMKSLGIDAGEVKPMLKEFYLASQAKVDDATFDQMDDPRAVRKFDLDSLDAEQNDGLRDRIDAAEQATNHDATPAQKEAGNYAKGKFPWNGLTISVETAKGEGRTDKETNGEKWRVTMPATYGYVLGTKGADGDHVDVFMGDQPESGSVYVINQTKPDLAAFDEHKVMLGYASEADAKADYLASFSGGFGKKVFGSMEGPFSVAEFRQMLDDKEFERAEPLDMGRRLDDSTPLSEITVTVEAIEAETGQAVEIDEPADEALKDIDDRMNLARSLLECLAS